MINDNSNIGVEEENAFVGESYMDSTAIYDQYISGPHNVS